MKKLHVKDWHLFQHYKDRFPPWIKLHKGLLDNYEFHRLPDASRALAPMIWLLASESNDGSLDYDEDKIAFRLRLSVNQLKEALEPLINGGFLRLEGDDSAALAERKRDAMPETEEEEEKNISSKEVHEVYFERFWQRYPRKQAKPKAQNAFAKALKTSDIETIMAGLEAYIATKPAYQDWAMPATWLNQERWADEPAPDPADKPTAPVVAMSDAVREKLEANRRNVTGGNIENKGPNIAAESSLASGWGLPSREATSASVRTSDGLVAKLGGAA